MTFTSDPNSLQDSTRPSMARRRRARRALVPATAGERAKLLAGLARRAFPSIEFFLFSVLCGAVLGAGFMLNSPGLLVVGALLAPLLTPWVGFVLATVTGSLRYFLQALGSLLVGGGLALLVSALAGLASRLWLELPLERVAKYPFLWWPDLVVTAFGAILLVVSFIRSEARPALPSVMLAYEIFLPLSAAGFGLGRGQAGFWPQGLLVALVHLSLATLAGMLTLAALRFRPHRAGGVALGLVVLLASLVLLAHLTGLWALVFGLLQDGATPDAPGATLAPLPTLTPTMRPSATIPPTPESGVTPSATLEIPPSQTPTETPTPGATPVYGVINAGDGYTGANIREAPGFDSVLIGSLANGSLVTILPENETVNGIVWVHVYVESFKRDGWVLQTVLLTATPSPNW
ncbi:MAG: DUF389 domain-containing protein [Chloroflexi bacterium]|nr:DUF389 domain-containing protein [Chloroflexota bacterium]